MSDLTQVTPQQYYGDLLTTTNGGQGLSDTLEPLQDGLGRNSTITISQTAVNFDRQTGNTFQLDGVPMTATSEELNSLAGGSTPGNFVVTNNLIVQRNLFVEGGIAVNRTPINVSLGYDILQTDYIIAITANTGGGVIALPTPAPGIYQTFIIKDEIASLLAHNVDVVVSGGALIDGSPDITLNDNFQCIVVYSNGSNYFIVSNT